MIELPTGREIAQHEAAHCALAIAVDWTPMVVRTDWPKRDRRTDREVAGSCQHDFSEAGRDLDGDTLRLMIMITLSAPLADGLAEVVGEWPIDLDDERWDAAAGDAGQLALLVRLLGLDEVDFRWLLHRTGTIMRTRRYRELAAAIRARLERCEVVGRPELIELTREVDQRLSAAEAGARAARRASTYGVAATTARSGNDAV